MIISAPFLHHLTYILKLPISHTKRQCLVFKYFIEQNQKLTMHVYKFQIILRMIIRTSNPTCKNSPKDILNLARCQFNQTKTTFTALLGRIFGPPNMCICKQYIQFRMKNLMRSKVKCDIFILMRIGLSDSLFPTTKNIKTDAVPIFLWAENV